MLRLIGATFARDAARANGCEARRVGDLAALFAPPADAGRLAVECLFSLPAFLPIARGDAASAPDWIAANAAEVDAALRELAGLCELVLTLDFPDREEAPAGPSGRDWLRSRLATDRAGTAATTRAEESLRAIVARGDPPVALEARALRRDGRAGAEIGLLVPLRDHRGLAEGLIAGAHRELGEDADARFRLSGPWPPYGFAARALATLAEPVVA